MKKINKEQHKQDILALLKRVKEPIWVSDISKKYGLAWSSLGSKKNNPASVALRELIKEGKAICLFSREHKDGSRKKRVKICLPTRDKLKQHAKSYFEYSLAEEVNSLRNQLRRAMLRSSPMIAGVAGAVFIILLERLLGI